MASSRPNTAEGVVELVQLPAVGVEHLQVEGFNPHLTFCYQNLKQWKSKKTCNLILSLLIVSHEWGILLPFIRCCYIVQSFFFLDLFWFIFSVILKCSHLIKSNMSGNPFTCYQLVCSFQCNFQKCIFKSSHMAKGNV